MNDNDSRWGTVGFRTSDGWVGLGWVDAVKQLARATRTSGRPGWRAPLARRGQWGCRPSRRTPARQRMSGDQRRMMAPGGGRHSREQKNNWAILPAAKQR